MAIYIKDNCIAVEAEYEVRFYYIEDGHVHPYTYGVVTNSKKFVSEVWDLTDPEWLNVWRLAREDELDEKQMPRWERIK